MDDGRAERALLVTRAGLHTTLQDGGRAGFQHLGVPVGGALDRGAWRRANALVGNADEEAVLEVTLLGCALSATADLTVAVTGAEFGIRVDDEPRPTNMAIALPAGATLDLGHRRSGARAYVAVRGGFDTPRRLGSRSAWPLLPRRGAVQDGDVLSVANRVGGPVPVPGTLRAPMAYRRELRVLPGPDLVDDTLLDVLCAAPYRVASSATRMAYPLDDGQPLPLVRPDRRSSGTVSGALQVFPSGQPALLMAECQTTGGYPIAAVVIGADLDHAAQLAPGDPVRFSRCTPHEALQAAMRMEASWA